ncbi:VOC family protein [Actinoplanes couchii]|nr:VOC family protein [Actinoplanes couchii]MDR6319144.1 catechol 2,3-dioxygenase-like lactoylglutathione lyase family enzyme [Actinoplanes couchii]
MTVIAQISLGVADAERAGRFWCRALNYVRRAPRYSGDEWIVIEPRPGDPGAPIAMDLSESPIQEQPRIHFDLDAGEVELDVEVQRLVSLGAKHVDWPHYPEPSDEPPFVVLADTEGNRFCVSGRRLLEKDDELAA